MKRWIMAAVVCLFAVGIGASAAPFWRKSDPAEAEKQRRDEAEIRLQRAEEYLRDIQKSDDESIPTELFNECRGIIIIRQYKAGFIIGGKGGRGVALLKDEKTGQWSAPAFISTAEGSIGWQIGGQSSDTILLVMNQEGVEMLLKTKFKIGVDASAAAGPVGRDASAKAGVKTALLAYSRSKGLYAGMSIEGGMMMLDGHAHGVMYGDEKISVNEILVKRTVAMPDAAKPLITALEEYSIAARIAVEKKKAAGPRKPVEPVNADK